MVVYLVGFARELAAAELALDLPLGAVVLQVVGQVAARQLDRAAVGAGDDVEGAGGEVALEGGDKQRGVRGAMFGSRLLLDSGSRGSAGARQTTVSAHTHLRTGLTSKSPHRHVLGRWEEAGGGEPGVNPWRHRK